MAARSGETALAHRLHIGRGAGGVLCITLWKTRDCRGTKPDQRGCKIVSIALKIPPQAPGLQRDRQPVIGPCEMVDPDLVIAIPDQQVAGGLEQLQPLFRARQGVRRDHHLPPRHPRHMRIAVKRDPVGVQRQKLLDRDRNPFRRLVRQPVKDVGVQRADPMRAQRIRRRLRDLKALVAADGLLDHRIEVLHPDRSAVHPRLRQRRQTRFVDLVRVDLNREFAVLRHRHNVENCSRKASDRGRRQQGRRSPAPM